MAEYQDSQLYAGLKESKNVCKYPGLPDSYGVNPSLSEVWEGIGTVSPSIISGKRFKLL